MGVERCKTGKKLITEAFDENKSKLAIWLKYPTFSNLGDVMLDYFFCDHAIGFVEPKQKSYAPGSSQFDTRSLK
jgi:hypothetical protein